MCCAHLSLMPCSSRPAYVHWHCCREIPAMDFAGYKFIALTSPTLRALLGRWVPAMQCNRYFTAVENAAKARSCLLSHSAISGSKNIDPLF